MKRISEENLIELLQHNACLVADTRSNSAFIGWKVDGAQRRGHIPGATDLSADWFRFLDFAIMSAKEKKLRTETLTQRIQAKIKNVDTLVLCDNNFQDAKVVAAYLVEHGRTNLLYFNLEDWSGDLACYPKYHKIVPPEWVHHLIQNENPQNYKIFEANWGKESITFLGSHIPGAIHIDTNEFEQEPEWTHVSLDRLKSFIIDNGIKPATKIVIYSTGDQAGEYKTALMLEYLGYRNTYVLNGGYTAWRMKHFETEKGKNPKQSDGEWLNALQPAAPAKIMTIDEVKSSLANSTHQIIDIRPWHEYSAEASGYDYIPLAGRIPGTIYGGSWLEYKNPDDTMRNFADILQIWDNYHINYHEPMAYFCGSAGWGAAMVERFCSMMNIENVTVFEGGWCEWQLDPNNPIDATVLVNKF